MKVGIIGSGFTGLTAGYYLSTMGHKVVVFENEPFVGGLVSTILTKGGSSIERFYHHLFTNDLEAVSLINELGAADRLLWHKPKNAICMNRKIHPFTGALDLIRFRELSLISRIRTGLMVFKSRYINDFEKLDNMYAKDWIIKNAGRESYEKIWNPLLESKFGKDSDSISATWIWNKFKLRSSSTGRSGIIQGKGESLGYVDGSFGYLNHCLMQKIIESGGEILIKTPAEKISHGTGQYPLKVMFTKYGQCKAEKEFDKIIFTASPNLLANVASSILPAEYLKSLKNIKYKSNVCVMLEYSEPLTPYYWITIADTDAPFVLYIEHTNLIKNNRYGSSIVYLSKYTDADDKLYLSDNENIVDIFTSYLSKILPGFSNQKVISTRVSKALYAQPVVLKNYLGIMPDVNTPVSGLYLASMPQIFPEDRGLNHAVRLGKSVAEIITGYDSG